MVKKTALITGGTSGLGYELVKQFLEKGWNVGTFGRRTEKIAELNEQFGGINFFAMTCDLTVSNQIDNFLEEAYNKFQSVEVLILNGGKLGKTPLEPLKRLNLIDFRDVYETNVFANVSLIKKVIGKQKTRKLKIVHVTSDAGVTPYSNWSPYGSSKAAMDMVIRILNEEEKENNLTSFSFDPGDMNTEMHRLALPEDLPEKLKNPQVSARELFDLIEKGEIA